MRHCHPSERKRWIEHDVTHVRTALKDLDRSEPFRLWGFADEVDTLSRMLKRGDHHDATFRSASANHVTSPHDGQNHLPVLSDRAAR